MGQANGESRHTCANLQHNSSSCVLEISNTFNAQKISRWDVVVVLMVHLSRQLYACILYYWNLLICHVTRVGQKISGYIQQIKENATTAINSSFLPDGTLENGSPHFF
jgi:hypothetical protein